MKIPRVFAIKLRDYLALVILAGQISNALPAEAQDFRFARLSVANGLSQATVHAICQDTTGFLWLGTMDGLNRYDGYTFKIYHPIQGDSSSLSNMTIRSLFSDHTGTLWIGTENGLNRYIPEKDAFKQYLNDPDDSASLGNNIVVCFTEDALGNLWIGTRGGGLNLYNREKDCFTRYLVTEHGIRSIDGNFLSTILAEGSGEDRNLLIGSDKGFYSFNPAKGSFNFLAAVSNHFLRSITCIVNENNETTWLGTWGAGLLRWNRKTNEIMQYQYRSGDPNSIPENIILSVLVDSGGTLWVGTRGGGLAMYVPSGNNFIRILSDRLNPRSISDNTIQCSYIGQDGQLWFGTQFGGVNKFNPAQKAFRNLYYSEDKNNGLSSNLITSIAEDRNGIIWIGTRGGGLNMVKKDDGQMKTTRVFTRNSSDIPNNTIACLLEDHEQPLLWVGTDGSGLSRLNLKTLQWKNYPGNPGIPGSLSNAYLYSLDQEKDGSLWVGTWGTAEAGGLDLFNKEKEMFFNFRSIPGDSNSIAVNIIPKILIDSRGNLWLGTKGKGVYRVEQDKEMQKIGKVGTFRHFYHQEGDSGSLSHNDVFAIYEDRNNVIWIGTFLGLNRFDPVTESFIHYTRENGLPSNVINGILDDKEGNLWVSTARGLACIQQNGIISAFFRDDGLQDDVFLAGACYKSRSGEIFFGGTNGLTAFYPEEVKLTKPNSHIVITDIKIFDHDLREQKSTLVTGNELNIGEKTITLFPKDFMISIEFASIDFFASGEKNYEYKLEGFSDEWIQTSSKERKAVFTNLDPGIYTFRVHTSGNRPGKKVDALLTIIIRPPFYEKLWFRISIASIILSALGWILIRWMKRLREEKLQIEKNARESLFEERNQLRTLIDHIPDIIYIKDRKGKFIVANKELARMMGNRTPEDVENKADHQFFPPEVANRIFNDEQEIMRRGIPEVRHITPWYDHSIGKIFLSLTRVPLRNSIGDVVGLVGIGRDVSQLKMTEEKLIEQTSQLQEINTLLVERQEEISQQADKLQLQSDRLILTNQELERLNTTKDKLFSIIAHDLKNPFQAILGFTGLLSQNIENMDASERAEHLDLIKLSAENAFSLLDNLLNWARTQTDSIKFSPSPLLLDDVLEQNISFVSSAARKKKIWLYNDSLKDVIVSADRNLLNIILRNLLNNAIKFTGEGGSVHITTTTNGNFAEIGILDTGVGMSAETIANLFRFERFHSTSGTGGEMGTGLGLIISKEFVEKQGGTIRAESQASKGSSFFFTVPLNKPA
ncbi:MAG: two-component regulator propeller domain-containing protein [Bacteroidales bacterium]